MCLTAEHIKARVATEDIKCYKILQKGMRSYYHDDFQWEIGKLYETSMNALTVITKKINKAFHSYRSFLDAQEIHIHMGMPSLVVECTIPKGAKYFEGYHGYYKEDGFASNQLIINRVIPQEELFPDFDFENFPYKVGQKIKVYYGGRPYNPDTCITIEEIIPTETGVYIKTDLIRTYACNYTLFVGITGKPLFDSSPSITVIE